MEMLRWIEQQTLPLTLELPADADKVRLLRAAGLIAALFVSVPTDREGESSTHARVLAITAEGRAALTGISSPGVLR